MGGGHSRQQNTTKNATTTVVVQTNTERVTQVKEAPQEQVVPQSRFGSNRESPQPTNPDYSASPPVAKCDPQNKPTTLSSSSPPPSSVPQQNIGTRSPIKATSPVPNETDSFSRQQSDARSNQPQSTQSSQKSATSSSYSNQVTSATQKSSASQAQKNVDKPPQGVDFSAPGFIDNPPPPAEPPRKANNHNTDINMHSVNQGDAVLIDLSPSNTPRDYNGQGGNVNQQGYGDRRILGKEHFDSEKFRQANSKKMNQSREYDFDAKPNVARPAPEFTRASSGSGSMNRIEQSADSNPVQKPKFMGPTKQVFSMEDEILLDEILETTRA